MKNFFLHPATISAIITTAVVAPTAYYVGKSQGKKAATKADDTSAGNTGNTSTKTGTNS